MCQAKGHCQACKDRRRVLFLTIVSTSRTGVPKSETVQVRGPSLTRLRVVASGRRHVGPCVTVLDGYGAVLAADGVSQCRSPRTQRRRRRRLGDKPLLFPLVVLREQKVSIPTLGVERPMCPSKCPPLLSVWSTPRVRRVQSETPRSTQSSLTTSDTTGPFRSPSPRRGPEVRRVTLYSRHRWKGDSARTGWTPEVPRVLRKLTPSCV